MRAVIYFRGLKPPFALKRLSIVICPLVIVSEGLSQFAVMLINNYIVLVIVPNSLQIQLNSCFSDSSRAIPKLKESLALAKLEKNNDPHDEDDQPTKLFTCPVDRCVKRFQRYSSLENHLQYGNGEIVLERENLFEKARIIYRDKLFHGPNI